jgi:hypothetical protein
VPTNNQITLTILRIGEINRAPIPPVPNSSPEDLDKPEDLNQEDLPLDASELEIHEAIHPDGNVSKSHPANDEEDGKKLKHPKLSKIVSVLKGNTKATVEGKLAIDHVRAAAGSEKAKGHLGVLPKKKNIILAGPSKFRGRFDGKKGWINLTDTAVIFSRDDKSDDTTPVLTILCEDIKQLQRATAFSMKVAEGVADWGQGSDLLGGLEIVDKEDKTWRFTAVPERDALFNRLIAIGGQQWEHL